jgi:hypothetical protein
VVGKKPFDISKEFEIVSTTDGFLNFFVLSSCFVEVEFLTTLC